MKIVLLLFLLLNTCLTFSQTVYMKVNKNDGTSEYYPIQDIRKITFSGLSGINSPEQMQNVVKTFNMLKSYPNPFNSSTTIEYEIPERGDVEITIIDVNGKLIRNLLSESQISGKHQFIWDSKDNSGNTITSGIYYCNVKFNNQILHNKMILIK